MFYKNTQIEDTCLNQVISLFFGSCVFEERHILISVLPTVIPYCVDYGYSFLVLTSFSACAQS